MPSPEIPATAMTPAPGAPLLIERSRVLLRLHGRDPVKMIHGLATADIEAVTADQGAYTAFLTPKGRMVADARVFRRGDDLLIDTAPDAGEELQEHFKRSIPPLFARAEDVSGEWVVVGVYGVDSERCLERAAASASDGDGSDADEDGDAAAVPGEAAEEAVVDLPGLAEGAFAVFTRITGEPGWDVFVPAAERDRVVGALESAGARAADPEVLEALRVAAGRPRWGRELSPEVIPLEAGLLDRAISQGKGCYTGQEVIVRILHRGHVNRHLRRLQFAEGAPEPGTELFEPGNPKPRGIVTSVAANEAGALGLGYVRREVDPPAELRVGSPEGPAVGVEALD